MTALLTQLSCVTDTVTGSDHACRVTPIKVAQWRSEQLCSVSTYSQSATEHANLTAVCGPSLTLSDCTPTLPALRSSIGRSYSSVNICVPSLTLSDCTPTLPALRSPNGSVHVCRTSLTSQTAAAPLCSCACCTTRTDRPQTDTSHPEKLRLQSTSRSSHKSTSSRPPPQCSPSALTSRTSLALPAPKTTSAQRCPRVRAPTPPPTKRTKSLLLLATALRARSLCSRLRVPPRCRRFSSSLARSL